jgi:hypothetical protein
MVSPTLTTTAPLACLASLPVSIETTLPPIVRETDTGRRGGVRMRLLDVDMECTYISRRAAVREREAGTRIENAGEPPE